MNRIDWKAAGYLTLYVFACFGVSALILWAVS